MGDMLSQAEIDALLNGTSSTQETAETGQDADDTLLSPQEMDAIGEIGNISMGTSATTLFTLLGQKVLITTPVVSTTSWEELASYYTTPYVAVKVEYIEGLEGANLMIMKEEDVKIITDLMMGGDGSNTAGELNELHLSAIGEAMNQMIGSASTSMSSMFNTRIDISPPKAFAISFNTDQPYDVFDRDAIIVKTAFKMVIGNLIDSEIMQLIPLKFAKDLVANLLSAGTDSMSHEPVAPEPADKHQAPDFSRPEPVISPKQDYQGLSNQMPARGFEAVLPEHQTPSYPYQGSFPQHQAMPNQYQPQANQYSQPAYQYEQPFQPRPRERRADPVNVQPVQFQTFDDGRFSAEKENISLLMDVPLQVTVELGRTQKLIKEILEFGQGQVIELDKLAGEPVDILINGRHIAKGEVVVIDESFGVRITDIVHPSKRI